MLMNDPNSPVMFYNGATRDARWRIGWVAFDRDCRRVIDRGIEPLIIPPPVDDRTATDIAFAASVIVRDSAIRSEEHTSALQSLMRNSYDVFCLKTKNKQCVKQ